MTLHAKPDPAQAAIEDVQRTMETAPPVVSNAYLRRNAFRIHAPGPRIEARIGRMIREYEAQHHEARLPNNDSHKRGPAEGADELRREIALLLDEGLKPRAIARRMGLTPGKVEHHVFYIRRGYSRR